MVTGSDFGGDVAVHTGAVKIRVVDGTGGWIDKVVMRDVRVYKCSENEICRRTATMEVMVIDDQAITNREDCDSGVVGIVKGWLGGGKGGG